MRRRIVAGCLAAVLSFNSGCFWSPGWDGNMSMFLGEAMMGGGLGIAGLGLLLSNPMMEEGTEEGAGEDMAIAGLALLGGGAVLWAVGKENWEEYQRRSQLHVAPNGVALTCRF